MKYLFSLLLYLFGSVMLSVFCYIALDGGMLTLAVTLALIAWTAIYLFLDKFVLVYLNSREVIDTDEQELFQKIKNEVYKSSEKVPKVYLYQGEGRKCFVVESRNSWGIIIEKNLLKSLNSSQLESLISFLFMFKRVGNPLIQTKVMGLTSLLYTSIYSLVKNSFLIFSLGTLLSMLTLISKVADSSYFYSVLILHLVLVGIIFRRLRLSHSLIVNENSISFKVLSLFLISLLRPVILSLEFFAKKKYQLNSDLALEPIANKVSFRAGQFDQFLIDHLKRGVSLKVLLMDHIESFPVLENCSFEKNRS